MNSDLFADQLAKAREAKAHEGKKRLKISFSGGQSSAFMTKWLLDNVSDQYEIVVTFANTGEEREETLRFVKRCDDEWGFNTVWLEAVVDPVIGEGTRHKVVTFETASRKGEPYEEVTKKYGISNATWQPCNRELKLAPMKSYTDSIGWKAGTYYTAIGIRIDENRRIDQKKVVDTTILYPLIDMVPMTKEDINDWWDEQPFRLGLKEHEGNCKWCWKKSDAKLFRLIAEAPEIFEFPRRMERLYGHHGAPHYGNPPTGTRPRVFFRNYRSTNDLFALAAEIEVLKARQLKFDFDRDEDAGCTESCEAYPMEEAA